MGDIGHNPSSAFSPECADGGRGKCAHARPESISKQHMGIANYTTASYSGLPGKAQPPGELSAAK